MEFCIATVEFWEGAGFDCSDWRKSVDGTKAMVHAEYAGILVRNLKANPNVTVYKAPSAEFNALLNSTEWLVEEEL